MLEHWNTETKLLIPQNKYLGISSEVKLSREIKEVATQWALLTIVSRSKTQRIICCNFGCVTRTFTLRPRHWPKVERHVSNIAGVNFTVAVVVAEYWVKLTHVQKQNANVAKIHIAA